MSNSVVFQVFSETGDYGVDYAIVAAAIVRVLREQGIEAFVRNEGAEGLTYATEYGDIPEASDDDLAACEVLLRAWPAGQWPTRPSSPRTVVDFVRRPADRSGEADFVVAFETDGSDFPGLIAWGPLFPLPIEVNAVAKEIVDGTIIIHLGQDPLGRLSGVFTAVDGFAGMSAVGLRYPDGSVGPGITPTSNPWELMASGDVAIVTPEFPFRLAAAMRIPAVLVASSADEEIRALELVSRGFSSLLYLGALSGLTNNQVRDAARDLRNDDSAKRIARLGGGDQKADQGVKRIADWVGRELLGRGLHVDPYHVQGYDTVFDAYTQLPLNAEAIAPGVPGGEEDVPADVQIFFTDGIWTKPAGSPKMVYVRMIGGGSGGGAGRRGAAGTTRFGGGGGAGGNTTEGMFPAQSLPATVTVVVGIGGIGAPAVLVDDTSGSDGTPGSNSEFGDFLDAVMNAGTQGAGGSNLAGFGGLPNASADTTYLGIGGVGGDGGAGAGTASGGAGPIASAGGGGGGGGISAANAAEDGALGGAGSAQRTNFLLPGAAGVAALVDGGSGTSAEAFNPQGAAGGGGGASNGATAGAGGGGGFYGGGGGGGAASLNGSNSGAGGDGGPGIVVVTTFF